MKNKENFKNWLQNQESTVYKKDSKKLELARSVLNLTEAVLIMVGDITLGIFESFHPHPYYHIFCDHRPHSFESTRSRLRKDGYIERIVRDGKNIWRLTQKGEEKRNKALHDLFLYTSREEPWDGRWRIIIFDIPEKIRKRRDLFRMELYTYGFLPLQKSVWVTPFKVAEGIVDSVDATGLNQYINFAVVETWYDDEGLRKMFF